MADGQTRGGHPDTVATRPANALHLATLAAVAGGGAIGTLLRAGLDAAMPHAPTGLAASTLLVNVLGAAVLGGLVGSASPRLPGWARAGLGTGLLGSFTTYSALAVSVVQLTDGGRVVGAIATVVLTLLLGIGAAGGGLAIGRRLAPVGGSPEPWPEEDE